PTRHTHRCKQNEHCDVQDATVIAAHTDPRAATNKPTPQRSSKSDRPLKRGTPAGDQMITGIALTAVDTVVPSARLMLWISCGSNGRPRNFQFGEFRAACEPLDRAAVEITRRKIHAREVAGGLQHIGSQPCPLDQLLQL